MDLAEIEAELAEIEKKEASIDVKIEKLLNDYRVTNESLSCVFTFSNELVSLDVQVSHLHDKLTDTAALSEKISKRVSYTVFVRKFLYLPTFFDSFWSFLDRFVSNWAKTGVGVF